MERNGATLDAAGIFGRAYRWISAIAMTRNTVVCGCSVRNIKVGFARHVTARAIVISTPLEPDSGWKAAPDLAMALQAAVTVIGHLLFWRRKPVRIVTRDATEPASAGLKTPALVHLLDLTDKPAFAAFRRLYEDCPEPLKRQSGPVVFLALAHPYNAVSADQVALLANGIAQ
jgi:hypothetical protein